MVDDEGRGKRGVHRKQETRRINTNYTNHRGTETQSMRTLRMPPWQPATTDGHGKGNHRRLHQVTGFVDLYIMMRTSSDHELVRTGLRRLGPGPQADDPKFSGSLG